MEAMNAVKALEALEEIEVPTFSLLTLVHPGQAQLPQQYFFHS